MHNQIELVKIPNNLKYICLFAFNGYMRYHPFMFLFFFPGNNLYNAEIATFLSEHKNSKERNAYILMQRIFPWQQRNYLVKTGVPFILSDVVSELGVYGVYIG